MLAPLATLHEAGNLQPDYATPQRESDISINKNFGQLAQDGPNQVIKAGSGQVPTLMGSLRETISPGLSPAISEEMFSRE